MGSDRNKDKESYSSVDTRTMTAEELAQYDRAKEALDNFTAPVLASEEHPKKRVFIAAFDGTGNDKDSSIQGDVGEDKRRNTTNVADMADSLMASHKEGKNQNIGIHYVEGVGTQENALVRTMDGAFGHTYHPRMEEMYYNFCKQAKEWKQENPDAEISVASVGFSRGAVTAAMFSRMVEERGIQDPDLMEIERVRDGVKIKSIAPGDPIVAPGQTPQAVGLFDPVATGRMEKEDLRLAPSVVSGFQIDSDHERRDKFALTQIIDPGVTENGRFLSVDVPGAHSDNGGSYKLNGGSIRAGNLMNDYFNTLTGSEAFKNQPVPTDPDMNVVHDSKQHLFIYTSRHYDEHGQRRREEVLATERGPNGEKIQHRDAEPVNKELDSRLEKRDVRISAESYDHRSVKEIQDERRQKFEDQEKLRNQFHDGTFQTEQSQQHSESQQQAPAKAQSDISRLFDEMTAAAARGDKQGVDAATLAYANSPDGQAWLQAGRDANQQQEQQQQAQQAEQQRQQQAQQLEQQNEVQRAPVMRM